jgi:catechol 2,3-dioxygenase-like lactoylglutathione lyase family enzyme
MDVGAFPILPARDLVETRAFYERLGFRTVGWWPDAFGGYAIVSKGMLQMHFFRFPELDPASTYAQCYWSVADVDALYAEIAHAGITVATPEDKPWGMREFALSDPNGTLVRVGQPVSRS